MATLAQCDAFGFIYDQAGAPSAGTLVTLKKVVDADGNPILLGPLVTTTDATGAYHFTVPQGSTAYVSARADQLWNCNGGTAMLVPTTASGELIPAFAPPASFAVAPPMQFIGNVLSIPKASASQDGYLSAADWQLFNAGGAGTAGVVTFNGRSGAVVPVQTDYAVFTPVVQGMVPASGSPSTTKFLRDDGQWAAPAGSGAGLLPGEYLVSDFNASGSAQKFAGSINAGSKTLTLTTAGDFKVGQAVWILSAGPSVAPLITRVDAIDVTKKILTVHDAATFTVSAVDVQHDDTAGIQSCIDAVCAAGGGTIIFPQGYYRINKGFTNFNSILKIPKNLYTSPSLPLALKAQGPPGYLTYAGGITVNGCVIIQTDLIGPAGASMISGGPYPDGSMDWTQVNNTCIEMEGLVWRTYNNPQISAVDLSACGNFTVLRDVSIDTGINLLTASEPTFNTFGIHLPGNSTSILIESTGVVVNNYGIGVIASEIVHFKNTIMMQCKVGLRIIEGYHLLTGRFLIWHCPTVIEFASSTIPSVINFEIDVEQAIGPPSDPAWVLPAANHSFYDPSDGAVGKLDYIAVQGSTGAFQDVGVTGMSRVTLTNLGGATRGGTGLVTLPSLNVSSQMKLYDGSVLQPVSLGANDSANAAGYREMRVANSGADVTAPAITGVGASGLSVSGATISWTTDEPSDSQVEYGTSTGYGSSTALNASMVTSHSATLAGLSAATLYHYRVKSRDAAGNLATSTDHTFSTTAVGANNLLTNLVSMWKLDEPTATDTRVDSRGANPLTPITSVASAAGKLNSAAHFLGTANYLNHTSNANLQGGEIDYTFAMWVNLDSKTADSAFISKGGASGGAHDEYIVDYDHVSDRFRVTLFTGTAGVDGLYVSVLANSAGSPAVGTWHLIVFWHDNTLGRINIQVDNGGVDSVARGLPVIVGSDPFVVGSYGPGIASLCTGLVDELALWKNRILDAPSRAALWNSGAGLPFSSWS